MNMREGETPRSDNNCASSFKSAGKRRGPPLPPIETFPIASPFSLCACPPSEASYVQTPVASNRAKTRPMVQHTKKRQIIPQETMDHLHGMLESLTFGILQPSALQVQHSSFSAPPPSEHNKVSSKYSVTLFPVDAGHHNDCGVPTMAPPRCRDRSIRRSTLGPTTRGTNRRSPSRGRATRGSCSLRTSRWHQHLANGRPSPPGALPIPSSPSASGSSRSSSLKGMEVRARPDQHRTHFGPAPSLARARRHPVADDGGPPPLPDTPAATVLGTGSHS